MKIERMVGYKSRHHGSSVESQVGGKNILRKIGIACYFTSKGSLELSDVMN
jgi:hypothetical protein